MAPGIDRREFLGIFGAMMVTAMMADAEPCS